MVVQEKSLVIEIFAKCGENRMRTPLQLDTLGQGFEIHAHL